MALSGYQVLLIGGMLLTGSINTLSKKAQNDCVAPGVANHSANGTATEHSFNHPWFQTVIMFVGEMGCLIGLFVVRQRERNRYRRENIERLSEVSGSEDVVDTQPRICQLVLAIPTICDLFGTSLAGIGLVYVNASVWQMLRGSIVIFTSILSVVFLKRRLRWVHWVGVAFTTIGLALVGISSVLNESNKHEVYETAIGISLILGGQLVSATQMIIEESFLKNRSLHPLHVVGMEGTFGFFIMSLIVLPAMFFIPGNDINGNYENSLDALYQIGNDPKLLVFSLLYLMSIAFYNFFGLAVTKSLTDTRLKRHGVSLEWQLYNETTPIDWIAVYKGHLWNFPGASYPRRCLQDHRCVGSQSACLLRLRP
ncbi:PREDICTED: solute carrier family 35 member F6-like isoform X2 [Priapulus caudatus]|uniref:Solute carrier family 35 member F6-like isoform X2 n=1 Tax=Priapulus caudatus TaxID=37621 RepID=A0ABM1EMZ1_PRICU|nr:PREDICTED: solute carrier family 35 member F6-like isoform X2 [Priapulus caudatus]